jgi:hypothetical protein
LVEIVIAAIADCAAEDGDGFYDVHTKTQMSKSKCQIKSK